MCPLLRQVEDLGEGNVLARPPRVASQHRIDPATTIAAPFQNVRDSGACSSAAARAAENTGMKYDAPANTVTLPCKMPTFHAA